MFQQMLYAQWKWSRTPLLAAVLLSFAVPILSLWGWTDDIGTQSYSVLVQMELLEGVGIAYPILAAAIGLVLAMTAWFEDHRGSHVYALSLPLPRWYYVLQKLGAGAVLLLPPVAALWAGALLASALVTIPDGMHTYPTGLMLRFALTSLIAYCTFFAISASTNRTAAYVLGPIAGLVTLQVLLMAASIEANFLLPVLERLMEWPSPFEIFGGRWVLIDV